MAGGTEVVRAQAENSSVSVKADLYLKKTELQGRQE